MCSEFYESDFEKFSAEISDCSHETNRIESLWEMFAGLTGSTFGAHVIFIHMNHIS